MNEPLIGYGPQGFNLEVNPWATESSTNRALLCRGAFLASWANVETALIEIAIRASRHAAYAETRDTYPSKLKSRVAYLRELLALPGPLAPYRSLGEAIIQRYLAEQATRNRLAHGSMKVLPDWGADLYGFEAQNGTEITRWHMRLFPADLERLARRSTRFSRAIIYLKDSLDQLGLLPPLFDDN
jgi:hypothetical protein